MKKQTELVNPSKRQEKDTKFKKGQPGGPGRKPLPKEIRDIIESSKSEIVLAYKKYIDLTPEVFADPKNKPKSMLEAGLQRMILNFARTGNMNEMIRVWEHIHGKNISGTIQIAPGGESVDAIRQLFDLYGKREKIINP